MLLISGRKIIMLRNYSANNTVKTVYKTSGYYNHTQGQWTIITLDLKLKSISIHPCMAAPNPSLVHFYFLREKYCEIEEEDLGYSFLMPTKANSCCEFLFYSMALQAMSGHALICNRLKPWVLTSHVLTPSCLLGGTEAPPGLSVLPWQSWQVIWRSQIH